MSRQCRICAFYDQTISQTRLLRRGELLEGGHDRRLRETSFGEVAGRGDGMGHITIGPSVLLRRSIDACPSLASPSLLALLDPIPSIASCQTKKSPARPLSSHPRCMLARCLRLTPRLSPYRPYAAMSSAAPPKRALSGSPPPSMPSVPASPPTKRVKLDDTTEAAASIDASAPAPAAAETPAPTDAAAAGRLRQKANNKAMKQDARDKGRGKGKGKRGKPHKAGGAEETGQFDVVELLGEARVSELDRMADVDDRDWRKEAELEWGVGSEGKDVEVRVVGLSAHGASTRVHFANDS